MRSRTSALIVAVLAAMPFAAVMPARAAAFAGCVVNGVPVTDNGTQLVFGTAGNDIINCSTSVSPVGIDAGAGNDRVIGSQAADWIQGGPGSDMIDGRGGSDWIAGDAGADYLVGGPGDDNIAGGNSTHTGTSDYVEIPGSGNDVLEGGPGSDTLDGDDGADVLRGGDDVDYLGGPPNDRARDLLIGGPGSDDGCTGFTGRPVGGTDPDVFTGCERPLQRVSVSVVATSLQGFSRAG